MASALSATLLSVTVAAGIAALLRLAAARQPAADVITLTLVACAALWACLFL